ncbi:protein-tyrosine phosphatase family protein [Glutamicibacter sp. AOP38-B1-38]|uniref:protein-tyrosine phosphatase family protein n=1 Tax=Glutamicibacter sp. AOP38-B1-38 TaxID=3457680 RepID=UPI004033A30A
MTSGRSPDEPKIWPGQEHLVRLPDGVLIRGSSLKQSKVLPPPDFGVYLLGKDPRFTDREYRWVKWRDFSIPSSTAGTLEALRQAYGRASKERVEIACRGGVGRTGTALAVVAVLGGIQASDAVEWVRHNYHPKAVETLGQRRWLLTVLPDLTLNDDH